MLVGVSSYSFYGAIRDGRMTLEDVPAMAAEMGFDGVEFAALYIHGIQSASDVAAELGARAQEAGMPVLAYCTEGNFIDTDLDASVQALIQETEAAADMGAKRVRFDVTTNLAEPWPSFRTMLSRLVEGCQRVADAAAALGVTLVLENHSTWLREAINVRTLIERVNRPNYGALVDIGNFMCVDENPTVSVGVLARYARHVHIKDFYLRPGTRFDPGEGWFQTRGGDFLRGTIVGHGDVPLLASLRALKNAGYKGPFVIEFEGMEPCEAALRIGLANLRRALETVYN